MAAAQTNRAAIRVRLAFSVAAGPLVYLMHAALYEFVTQTPSLLEALTRSQSMVSPVYIAWPVAALRVSGPVGLYLVLALIWSGVILWTRAKRRVMAATGGVLAVACMVSLYAFPSSYETNPLWWILAAGLAFAALTWCFYRPPSAAGSGAVPCPSCGYDLRGQRECRCPECGREFTLAELAEGR